jgi:formate hydrogenlyase transcriptional activator
MFKAGLRYETLIRLAEVIRCHPEEKDLFQTVASELHKVVPFDALCQFDAAANWIQWSFLEPYNKEFEALVKRPLPKDETLAGWVHENQQPVVVGFADQKPRFRKWSTA